MSKTTEEQISGLLRNAQENIKDAYDKGYKNGLKDGNINDGTFAAKVKEAYNNGLNDAWECAKKIAITDGLSCDELKKFFGYRSVDTIFRIYSASEAIEKIREYDDFNRHQLIAHALEVGMLNFPQLKDLAKMLNETSKASTSKGSCDD